jgi:single-strand DNA-binding protein
MSMQACAYGRIGQEPRSIETKSGKAMAVASIAVAVDEHDAPPLWLGIVAFGRVAEDLLRHQKGDLISVSGRVQRNTWTTPSGEKREQLQVVTDSVISSRTVRPGGARRRDDGHHQQQSDNRNQRELNDEIPF